MFTRRGIVSRLPAGAFLLGALSQTKSGQAREYASAEIARPVSCCPTVATLQSMESPKEGDMVLLSDDKRSGVFVFRSGDYSRQIDADVLGGVYLAAKAVASAKGAWVRQYEGPIRLSWFGESLGDQAFDTATRLVRPGGAILVDADVTISGKRTYTKPFVLEDGGGALIGESFKSGAGRKPPTVFSWVGAVAQSFRVTETAAPGDVSLRCRSNLKPGEVVVIRNFPNNSSRRRKEIAVVHSNNGEAVALNSGLLYTYDSIEGFVIERIDWVESPEIRCVMKNISCNHMYVRGLSYRSKYFESCRVYHSTCFLVKFSVVEWNGGNSACILGFNESSRGFEVGGYFHSIYLDDVEGCVKCNQASDGMINIVADSSNNPGRWSAGFMFDQVWIANPTGYTHVPSRNLAGRIIANGTKFALFGSSDKNTLDRAGYISFDVVCRSGFEQVRLKNVVNCSVRMSGGVPILENVVGHSIQGAFSES